MQNICEFPGEQELQNFQHTFKVESFIKLRKDRESVQRIKNELAIKGSYKKKVIREAYETRQKEICVRAVVFAEKKNVLLYDKKNDQSFKLL